MYISSVCNVYITTYLCKDLTCLQLTPRSLYLFTLFSPGIAVYVKRVVLMSVVSVKRLFDLVTIYCNVCFFLCVNNLEYVVLSRMQFTFWPPCFIWTCAKLDTS